MTPLSIKLYHFQGRKITNRHKNIGTSRAIEIQNIQAHTFIQMENKVIKLCYKIVNNTKTINTTCLRNTHLKQMLRQVALINT